MRDCIKRIVEQSGGALKQSEAKELLNQIDNLTKRAVKGGMDRDDAINAIVRERAEIVARNVAKEKMNMAKNLIIKTTIKRQLQDLTAQGVEPAKAFKAIIEGINSEATGAKDSLDAAVTAAQQLYMSRFIKNLYDEGLMEIYISGKFETEIGSALWDVSSGKKPAAGNKQTQRIAEIIHDTQERIRLALNDEGADIESLPSYMMPQRHDLSAMQRAGRDKYVSDMLEWLNPEKTFDGDYDDFATALRAGYDAQMTGIRLDSHLESDTKLFQFSGPANLAKRLSRARKYHFKDYASWEAWNKAYGMKNLQDGFIDSVMHQSNQLVLLKRFGTNPEAMMRTVASEFLQGARSDLAEKGAEGVSSTINSMIDYAMGKLNHPASPTIARWTSNIQLFQQVTKLGGALVSSFADILPRALTYQHQGKTILSSWSQTLKDVGYGFKSKKERVEFANYMGIYLESIVGDIGSRWGAVDNLNHKAVKLQRGYFKLNGQTWWTDSARQAFMRVTSHELANKKGVAFNDLDADTKRLFGNYNIKEADWDSFRANTKQLPDGREYILADGLPDNLAAKLIGYYIDRGYTAIPEPGATERRLATFGTQTGTPIGAFTRIAMQFKTFPITMTTKVWGQALHSKGKADMPAIAQLIIMSAIVGYGISTMKDLLKGREPKDPTKPETIFAALTQAGGMGIVGDVLLQDGTFGRPASAALLGPTIGTFDDLFKIYSQAKKGEFAAASAVRTAVGAVPGNNLYFARPALDQLLLYPIMEELSPGYLRRMESNMKRTYGQEFLFR
jgi:hypothetical protein